MKSTRKMSFGFHPETGFRMYIGKRRFNNEECEKILEMLQFVKDNPTKEITEEAKASSSLRGNEK